MKSTATYLGSLFSLAGIGLLAAACGAQALDGGANDPPPRACDNRAAESTCAEYPSGATKSDVEGSCDGTLITTSCATAQVVGSCSVLAARGALTGRPLTNLYYADGPRSWTEVTARQACDALNGSFVSATDGDGGDGGGRTNRGLGEGCEQNEQCASGLTCRQNFVADQCTAQKTCTLLCHGDASCKAVNPKALCFKGCNNEEICMLTP